MMLVYFVLFCFLKVLHIVDIPRCWRSRRYAAHCRKLFFFLQLSGKIDWSPVKKKPWKYSFKLVCINKMQAMIQCLLQLLPSFSALMRLFVALRGILCYTNCCFTWYLMLSPLHCSLITPSKLEHLLIHSKTVHFVFPFASDERTIAKNVNGWLSVQAKAHLNAENYEASRKKV